MLTEFTGGSSAITSLDVATGQSERLWQGDENLHAGGNYPNFSLARDGSDRGGDSPGLAASAGNLGAAASAIGSRDHARKIPRSIRNGGG